MWDFKYTFFVNATHINKNSFLTFLYTVDKDIYKILYK